jgi:hypothetical protein
MIEPDYLVHKPAGPPAPKRFVGQQVVPSLIDAAGSLETVLERISIRVRRSPGPALGIAAGSGLLLAFLVSRRRRA